MATKAQLRARRLFAQRYGGRKGKRRRRNPGEHQTHPGPSVPPWWKPKSQAPPWWEKGKGTMRRNHHRRYRHHHNPEEGGGKSNVLKYVLIGGAALILLPRLTGAGGGGMFGAGGILGGSQYQQVGTDAQGHPIYQAAAGAPVPYGYTQTGTSATGQPIYSYSGGGFLGTATPILGAAGGVLSAIARIFTPGGGGGTGPLSGGTSLSDTIRSAGEGGAEITGTLAGGSLSDIIRGGGGVGEVLGPINTGIGDLQMPPTWLGSDMPGIDFGVPELSLGLGTDYGSALGNLGGGGGGIDFSGWSTEWFGGGDIQAAWT